MQDLSLMDIGSSNIYRWANEVRDPNSETVVRIVEALEKINPDAAAEFRKQYMGDSTQDKEQL